MGNVAAPQKLVFEQSEELVNKGLLWFASEDGIHSTQAWLFQKNAEGNYEPLSFSGNFVSNGLPQANDHKSFRDTSSVFGERTLGVYCEEIGTIHLRGESFQEDLVILITSNELFQSIGNNCHLFIGKSEFASYHIEHLFQCHGIRRDFEAEPNEGEFSFTEEDLEELNRCQG